MENEQTPPAPQPGAVFGAGEQPTEMPSINEPLVAKPSDKPPKKSKKKLIIILLILALVAAGAVYWYFVMREESKPQASIPSVQQDKPSGKNELYFQIDTKLVSVDPETKKLTTLSDELPEGAEVLDFYSENGAWRAYYQAQVQEKISIFYLEKDKAAQEVYKSTDFVIAKANAKTKQVAYTVVYSVEEKASAEQRTTRHYVHTDGKTVLLAQSVDKDQSVVGSPMSLKSLSIAVEDISPDGSKLLFVNVGKFYTEGTPSGLLEYELTSKTSNIAAKEGRGWYDPQGNIVNEIANDFDRSVGFGDPSSPLEYTQRHRIKEGAPLTDYLVVKEATWQLLIPQKQATGFFAAEKRNANYPEDYLGSFAGFYRVGGTAEGATTAVGYEKVNVDQLPSDSYSISEIGDSPVDADAKCFGMTLARRQKSVNESNENAELQTGIVCIGEGGKLKYEKIEEFSFKSSDEKVRYVSVL